MMLSIIGALIGFAGSAVPHVLDYVKKKEDNKKDLEVIRLQGELAKQGAQADLLSFHAKAKDEEHKRLIDHDTSLSQETGFFGGLRKSVRPLITYMFFALFAAVKISMLYESYQSGNIVAGIKEIWDEETQSIFAAIVSFWFGSRALEKRKG